MTGRESRLGGGGLIRRHLRDGRSQALVLGVVTLIVTAAVAAAPSAFARTATAELTESVAGLSPNDRNLISVVYGNPPTSTTEAQAWEALTGALASARHGLPDPLRSAVGEGRFVVTTAGVPIESSPRVTGLQELQLMVDPTMKDALRIQQGDWPAPVVDGAALPVVLSESTAAAMGWAVGEQRLATVGGHPGLEFELAGTFAALDSAAEYWLLNRSVLEPTIRDDGNAPRSITGTGYLDPASWGQVATTLPTATTRIWFPVHPAALAELPVTQTLAQLGTAIATNYPLEPGHSSMRLHSELPDVMQDAAARTAAAGTVLAIAMAGPIGAAIAVLALGALVVAQRRRAAVDFLAARGASGRQLRALTAVEGAIICLPATALGVLLAAILGQGELVTVGILVAVVVGVLPVFALMAVSRIRDGSTRRSSSRPDSPSRIGGRVRGLLELTVIALAALSVTALVSRPDSTGPDLLVLATPLLLTLAACVLVGRLYPLPLLGLQRFFGRRSGLVGYLGTARAVRDPAVGVLPVLALVTGVSVVVFSSTMLATVTDGIDVAASTTIGADLRADSVIFDPAALRAVREIAGVGAVAPVDSSGSVLISGGGGASERMNLYLTDAAALAEVQQGIDGAVPTTALTALTGPTPDGLPVIASVAAAPAGTAERPKDQRPVTVVGSWAGQPAGFPAGRTWLLADRQFADAFNQPSFAPSSLLIRLLPDADAAAIGHSIVAIGGPGTTVRSSRELAAAIAAAPILSGLRSALLAVLVIMAGLCAVAVVMTSVLNASVRNRLLAILRVLGASPRQIRAVVSCEMSPMAAITLVIGTLLGVGLAVIVGASVDLRPATGGAGPPALTVDPLVLGLLLGGFVLVIGAAVVITGILARHQAAAVALTLDAE